MAQEHGFRVKTIWTGAAEGPTIDYRSYSREHVVEIDGKPPLRGSSGPAFRGDAGLHNPEDLLLAALSACHLLSYLALCARAGVRVVAYEDAATGTMKLAEGKMRFTEVTLNPRVLIEAGDDKANARALHDEAHELCFIANSVNFPVRHAATVTEAGGGGG
ncbi:MAG: OsmC family protein [Kiloniellales bacterium]